MYYVFKVQKVVSYIIILEVLKKNSWGNDGGSSWSRTPTFIMLLSSIITTFAGSSIGLVSCVFNLGKPFFYIIIFIFTTNFTFTSNYVSLYDLDYKPFYHA